MKFLPLITILLLPHVLFAAPTIPHQLYGTASNETGGTVTALINGDVIGSTNITEDGSFGYEPRLFFLEDPDGIYEGETVTFTINGEEANETVVFASGARTKIIFSEEAAAPSNPSSNSGGASLTYPPASQSEPEPVVVEQGPEQDSAQEESVEESATPPQPTEPVPAPVVAPEPLQEEVVEEEDVELVQARPSVPEEPRQEEEKVLAEQPEQNSDLPAAVITIRSDIPWTQILVSLLILLAGISMYAIIRYGRKA